MVYPVCSGVLTIEHIHILVAKMNWLSINNFVTDLEDLKKCKQAHAYNLKYTTVNADPVFNRGPQWLL